MFPYLTLHDATQTRNKNLLISHCYLTLELHTRHSPILTAIHFTLEHKARWESVFGVFGLRCQMFGEWVGVLYLLTRSHHMLLADITDITHHSLIAPTFIGWLVVTWLPGPAPHTRDEGPRQLTPAWYPDTSQASSVQRVFQFIEVEISTETRLTGVHLCLIIFRNGCVNSWPRHLCI